MASKYGFTVSKIQNMTLAEINKLNKSQMRDALQVMTDAANKRAARLEAAGETQSFAYQNKLPQGADRLRFTMPKTDDPTQSRNVLYHALTNVTEFMNAKTSTVSGWKSTKTTIKQAMFKPPVKTTGKTATGDYDENADSIFDSIIRDSSFWKFVRYLMNDYGYDSNSSINYATMYSSYYNTTEKIQQAISNIIGVDVDAGTVADTPIVDSWLWIFANTQGTRENMTRDDGTEWGDDAFNNIWRNKN